MRAFERASEIEALVPIARGAVIGLVDRSGRLCPPEVEDYSGTERRGGAVAYFSLTDPATDEVINRLASPEERYKLYGVPPNFVGYAVPGWGIADIALRYPEALVEAGGVALGPELFARLACGEAAPRGPQRPRAHLPDVPHRAVQGLGMVPFAEDIDRLVQEKTGRKLIGDLMPAAPGSSGEVFDYAEPGAGPGGAPPLCGAQGRPRFDLAMYRWWRPAGARSGAGTSSTSRPGAGAWPGS